MMNFEAEVWEEGVKESMKNARPEAWPETGRFSDQLIRAGGHPTAHRKSNSSRLAHVMQQKCHRCLQR